MFELITIIIISSIVTLIMSIRTTYIINKLKINSSSNLLQIIEFISSIITLIQIINIAIMMLLILNINDKNKNLGDSTKTIIIETKDTLSVIKPNIEYNKK